MALNFSSEIGRLPTLQSTCSSDGGVLTMNLSFAELLGDANDVNLEVKHYQKVSSDDIKRVANEILIESNCSTLIYAKKK